MNLTKLLLALGMRDVFDRREANLSCISNEKLFVAAAIHETKIEVDEEGAKAAAATLIRIDALQVVASDIFMADHPFIFLIVDDSARVILFMGNVQQFPPEP